MPTSSNSYATILFPVSPFKTVSFMRQFARFSVPPRKHSWDKSKNSVGHLLPVTTTMLLSSGRLVGDSKFLQTASSKLMSIGLAPQNAVEWPECRYQAIE
jgi:hypothetical protein